MNRRMPIAKTYYHNLLMYRQTNVTQIPLILTCVSCKLLGRIYFTLGLKYKLHYLYWINNLISIKNIDKKHMGMSNKHWNGVSCRSVEDCGILTHGVTISVPPWPRHDKVLQPLIHRLATPTCINNWLYCESSQVAPYLIYK